ncbi:MAG: hypothetical protein LBM92_07850, partial [Opitutaceae bacterium]|nr:hypothetical protein [Opitutaceae bacterium]
MKPAEIQSTSAAMPLLLCLLLSAAALAGAASAFAGATAAESHASLKDGRFDFNPALSGVHPRLVSSPAELKAAIAEWRGNPEKYASLADERNFDRQPIVPMNQAIYGWDIPRRVLLSTVLYLMTGESRHAELVHR